HLEAALAQALEGLGRRHLVDQVQVDEQQRGSAGALVDYVRVPEFFDDGAWHKLLDQWGSQSWLPPAFQPAWRLEYSRRSRLKGGCRQDCLPHNQCRWLSEQPVGSSLSRWRRIPPGQPVRWWRARRKASSPQQRGGFRGPLRW